MDTYTSLRKGFLMLKLVLLFYQKSKEALEGGAGINDIFTMEVRERIARAKYIHEGEFEQYYSDTVAEMDSSFGELMSKEEASAE